MRDTLSQLGVIVAKSYEQQVKGGTEWKIHFTFAASMMSRKEAKLLAAIYINEQYGVDEVAYFANPDSADNKFYAVFFTSWR